MEITRGVGPHGPGLVGRETFERPEPVVVEVWLDESTLDIPTNVPGWNHLTSWCERSGVGYQRYLTRPDQPAERIDRWAPLHRDQPNDGSTRTIGVKFFPTRPDPAVRFTEIVQRPVEDGYASYDVESPYVDVDEDGLIAMFAAWFGDGDVGAPGEARDRVARWYAEHERPYRISGLPYHHHLLDVLDGEERLVLDLVIDVNQATPSVRVVEIRGPVGQRLMREYAYSVRTPLDSIDRFEAYAVDQLSVARPFAQRPDQRFTAVLDGLVANGHLAPGSPPRTLRNRVAAALTAAGAEAAVHNNTRTDLLLRVHRSSTDCIFQLRLTIDPDDRTKGITFWEEYEYLPRPGDAGREYRYGARTPYDSLAPLVAQVEQLTGEPSTEPDLEDRLAHGLTALVRRGDLADEQPLRANRDRVLGWYEAASVPADPVDSAWINSD